MKISDLFFERLIIFSVVILTTIFNGYAYQAYVGESFSLNAPSVSGTIDAAAWYCDNHKNEVTVSGNTYGANVRIDTYFSGEAVIICQYAYRYYIAGKVQHGKGTARFTFSCKKSEITLDSSEIKLKVGQEKDLSYTNSSGYDLPFSYWETSDSKIAEIDNSDKAYGTKTVTVSANSPGECLITCKGNNGGKEKTCKVIVVEEPARSINLIPDRLVIREGKTDRFKYELTPSDATSSVSWESSDNNVATVSSGGTIKGVSGGIAAITAKTSNGLSASGIVEVIPQPTSISFAQSISIAEGYSCRLIPIMTPENAYSELKWSSSDNSVATIDGNGYVKALKEGYISVTVLAENGVSSSCRLNVYKPSENTEAKNVSSKLRIVKNLINMTINRLK